VVSAYGAEQAMPLTEGGMELGEFSAKLELW